jgi:L-ascorbate metabolism protein UlaG (beta-lactamase superfamily)
MQLSWLGHSCFKIQEKIGSNIITVITDPFDSDYVGLKLANQEADIVTISHDHQDHNNLKIIKNKPFVVDSAGEYEVGEIFIDGIDSSHDNKNGEEKGRNIIFRLAIGGLVITHLGDLGDILDTKQLERIEGTDILIIPVGGEYTINYKKAVEVVNQIEPRIIIPMHYNLPGLKIKLDGVDSFIKELGLNPRYEDKLKISKKDLPTEDSELIILNN